MKRFLNISAAILMLSSVGFAQSEVDALRFSQTNVTGTARSASMAGAFGALGGDFSSLSNNPAGLGIYRHSEFSFSTGLNYNITNSSFLGTSMVDSRTNLNINSLGFVGAYSSGDDEGWASVNFGIGYNRLNNFYNRMVIEGVNNESSMLDYFTKLAAGKDPSELSGFYEGGAYMTWLIDSVGPGQYASVLQGYNDTNLSNYGATQKKSLITEGGMGEYAFSLGANYGHKVYFGASLGVQDVRYVESYTYSETDENDAIYEFKDFEYNKSMKTQGYGFNLKVGVIYRPLDWIRLGAAVHTPTWYSLNYTYSSDFTSNFDILGSDTDSTIHNFTYNSADGEYNYEVVSPLRAIGSAAFIINKMALFSVDYEYVDYSRAQLNSEDAGEFSDANSSIRANYTAASNIKAGLEYTTGPFSIRAGAAYYGNPYASSAANSNSRLAYSGGFGVKDNNIYFDLAYIYMTSRENNYLYSPDVVHIQPAKIIQNKSQIMATFGVKF